MNLTINSNNTLYRYKIISHTSEGMITAQVMGKSHYLYKHANDLMNDYQILNGFSPLDISIIQSIVKSN